MALLDSPGDVMPIALNHLGRNPASLSEPHVDNAYRLIDHLLDPRVAAGFTSALFYQSAVTSSAALVDQVVC